MDPAHISRRNFPQLLFSTSTNTLFSAPLLLHITCSNIGQVSTYFCQRRQLYRKEPNRVPGRKHKTRIKAQSREENIPLKPLQHGKSNWLGNQQSNRDTQQNAEARTMTTTAHISTRDQHKSFIYAALAINTAKTMTPGLYAGFQQTDLTNLLRRYSPL